MVNTNKSKRNVMPSIWAATVISLTVIMCFLIPTRIFAADFTAKFLGDYGNATVMEVTGDYNEECRRVGQCRAATGYRP